MSLVGSPFGGCLKPGYQPPSKPSKPAEPESTGAPEGELNLKKFLSHKATEIKDECELSDTKPATILQDYYRETVSEGSGQYDEASIRKFSSMIRVRPADVSWFEKQVGPLSDDFASTVYGVVLMDAMSAMVGDPSLAAALYTARK